MTTHSILITPNPSPLAYALISILEHRMYDRAKDISMSEIYANFNQAIGAHMNIHHFATYWKADENKPQSEELDKIFRRLEATLNTIFPLAAAYTIAMNYKPEVLRHYENYLWCFRNEAILASYEALKNALIGIYDKTYTFNNIAEKTEISRLLFAMNTKVINPAALDVFHQLSRDTSKAYLITDMMNEILTWAMNLTSGRTTEFWELAIANKPKVEKNDSAEQVL